MSFATHYVMADVPLAPIKRSKRTTAMTASLRKASGFTLMETLLTLTIAGILSALSVSAYAKYIKTAKVASAVSDLGKIKSSIDRYRLNNNDLPPLSLAEVKAQGMKDPWGNPYVYLNFSTVNGNGQKRKDHNLVPINSEFDLYSKGADKESMGPLTASKSRDDVIMANDGGFIGLASEY
jgi:general secretion pathway protein G